MNRQNEIARKLAAELALPPAQRSRAGLAPPRDAVRADDGWSFDMASASGPQVPD